MAMFCQAMCSEFCLGFQNHGIGGWQWKWSYCYSRKHLQEHKLSKLPPSTVPEYISNDMHTCMAHLWIEGKFILLWSCGGSSYTHLTILFLSWLSSLVHFDLVQVGLICYASTIFLYVINCCFSDNQTKSKF